MSSTETDIAGIFASAAVTPSADAPDRANPQVADALAAALQTVTGTDTVRGWVLTPRKGRNRFCDDLRAAVTARVTAPDGYKVGTRTVKPGRATGAIVAVDGDTVRVLTDAERAALSADDDRVMAVKWREADAEADAS